MSAIETLATLYLEGRQVEMGPLFMAHVAEARRTDVEIAYEIYLNLYERGNHALALNFLMSFCNSFPATARLLLIFGKKIYSEQDPDVAANLLMTYLEVEGTDFETYDICLSYCMGKGLNELAASLYLKFRARFEDDSLSARALYNFGVAYMTSGNFAEGLRLFKKALAVQPAFTDPRMNIRHLALVEAYAPAIDFLRQDSNEIAGFRLADRRLSALEAPFDLQWTGTETEAIIDSLLKNGFCLIRGGCDTGLTAEIFEHLQTLSRAGNHFPINFTPDIKAALPGLFQFDPAGIIDQIVGRPFRIDETICVARRVEPDRAQSFVPFHQDSSAFSKTLFNVWTPVTPAGGAYPSVQFVRKLVTIAEQTKLFQGEYNLIEIEADVVLEKYGDLLYEVTDAVPGDCVMFYGTTIHRSYNLGGATQTRFNIETRWTLS